MLSNELHWFSLFWFIGMICPSIASCVRVPPLHESTLPSAVCNRVAWEWRAVQTILMVFAKDKKLIYIMIVSESKFPNLAHCNRLYEKSFHHFLAIASISLRDGVCAHCRDNNRRRSSSTILHLFWHNRTHWPSCWFCRNGGGFSRKGPFADITITTSCRGSSSGTCGGHHLPAS